MPATIAPSVTAGTAVPWSPTSPDSVVGDSGNPADWPAAQAKPPSLAGAYSTNMLKVIVTLITYEDWVGSHPNAALVSNYMTSGGNAYPGDFALMADLVKKGWHIDPSPSEIDWMGVTVIPKPIHLATGRTHVHRDEIYQPASVTVIINEKPGVLLNGQGHVVGHSSTAAGKAAFSEVLEQGTDRRWRIANIYKLNPTGGLGSLQR